MKRVKVAVTGAAGQIGYALLFRIANGDMFGHDTEVELQLLELESALPALHGVAMELDDCAFPLLRKITCTADVNKVMDGANAAILVGSVPRKQGMERSDLLQINGNIFTVQGKAINNYAAKDVKVFVVGNPCNTNCLIAMHSAPDIPRNQFYAMTMLDEKRARTQLAIKANVPVTAVKQLIIWGNHSSTQYPDFYNALINDQPATTVIQDHTWLKNDFINTVRYRGADVIKARGASSAASAANGAIASLHALTHDTPTGEAFSMGICSEGQYGIDPGLIFSMPCRVENGQLNVLEHFQHNEFGHANLQTTLQELRGEYQVVKELGLVKD